MSLIGYWMYLKCFRFSLDILFLLFTSILRADSFKSALQVDSSKEGGGAFLDMFFVAFWLEIKSKALKQALGSLIELWVLN